MSWIRRSRLPFAPETREERQERMRSAIAKRWQNKRLMESDFHRAGITMQHRGLR